MATQHSTAAARTKAPAWWFAMAGTVLVAGALHATSARAETWISVQVAPPPLRYEVEPAPLHGHLWVPGHWAWRHGQHVWVPGHHVVARQGYVYDTPRWARHGNGWGYYQGGWVRAGSAAVSPPVYYRGESSPPTYYRSEPYYGGGVRRPRDQDRDGVPDARDRDRDGDGVPNRYDRRPDNYWRR